MYRLLQQQSLLIISRNLLVSRVACSCILDITEIMTTVTRNGRIDESKRTFTGNCVVTELYKVY